MATKTKGKTKKKSSRSNEIEIFMPFNDRDIIFFVGRPTKDAVEKAYSFTKKNKLRLGLIHDKKQDVSPLKDALDLFDMIISCNFLSRTSIIEAIKPYNEYIKALVSRSDANIKYFAKVIPHVPFVRTPSTESLKWANDKVEMRKHLKAYNKKITPAFMMVSDSKVTTLKKIEEKVTLPVVLKPADMAASAFVTVAYHKDELKKAIDKILKKTAKKYKEMKADRDPEVLVEAFMEGDMYSIDAHVSSRGKIYFCPPVYIKTGFQIGFDDFFGYMQMTPTRLKKKSIEEAQRVVKEAVHALGLRSITVHIELIKTEDLWRVIEVNPRIGGFRDTLYELSYGINLTENDIRVRIPKPVKIPTRARGYAAVLKVFAKNEGVIRSILGIKRVKELKSLKSFTQNMKVGDKAKYAKNGGKSVANIIFFNKNRSALLADIRRTEQLLKIKTGK